MYCQGVTCDIWRCWRLAQAAGVAAAKVTELEEKCTDMESQIASLKHNVAILTKENKALQASASAPEMAEATDAGLSPTGAFPYNP